MEFVMLWNKRSLILFPDFYLKNNNYFYCEIEKIIYGYSFHYVSSPSYSHFGFKTRFEVIFKPISKISLRGTAQDLAERKQNMMHS